MDEKQIKNDEPITVPLVDDAKTLIQPVAPTLVSPVNPRISYDDFAKVELKVGKIVAAEAMPKSEKLLKLTVDFAEGSPRTILSGIAKYFPNGEGLVGRKSMFVTNLEPRKMMGMESNGMILAVSTDTGFSLLEPNETIPEGTKAK
jgi:methionyl-tRNA synthetase